MGLEDKRGNNKFFYIYIEMVLSNEVITPLIYNELLTEKKLFY